MALLGAALDTVPVHILFGFFMGKLPNFRPFSVKLIGD